jgi:hypothetical protein
MPSPYTTRAPTMPQQYSVMRAAAQPPLHASATMQAPAAGAAHLQCRHYNTCYYRIILQDIKPNARVPWAHASCKPMALGLFPRYLAKSLLLLINRSTIFLPSDNTVEPLMVMARGNRLITGREFQFFLPRNEIKIGLQAPK